MVNDVRWSHEHSVCEGVERTRRPLPTGIAGESNIESVKQELIAANVRSGSLQSVGSPEHAMHRPSNRLALQRKSTRRVMRTTGFPFKLKRVFPWGLLINSFVRYNGYTSVETANKSWNLICGSDRKRPKKKTDQEDGHGKDSGDPKDQENQNIQLLPTYTKNPTTRRKKN